jgi:hypothetical protein
MHSQYRYTVWSYRRPRMDAPGQGLIESRSATSAVSNSDVPRDFFFSLLCLNGKPHSDLATDSIVFIPFGDEWQARELTVIH